MSNKVFIAKVWTFFEHALHNQQNTTSKHAHKSERNWRGQRWV